VLLPVEKAVVEPRTRKIIPVDLDKSTYCVHVYTHTRLGKPCSLRRPDKSNDSSDPLVLSAPSSKSTARATAGLCCTSHSVGLAGFHTSPVAGNPLPTVTALCPNIFKKCAVKRYRTIRKRFRSLSRCLSYTLSSTTTNVCIFIYGLNSIVI
jgi:hypothetical protein